MNYRTNFRSIRDEVSAEEWQARVDLAACYRLVDYYGMTDLTYNHITARVPGAQHEQRHHILINLYGLTYKEITASSLARIDLDGEVIWKPDTDYYVNRAGYVIHGAVHRARKDVACVLHTHTRAGMAVAAMKCGLLPLSVQPVPQPKNSFDLEDLMNDRMFDSPVFVKDGNSLIQEIASLEDALEFLYEWPQHRRGPIYRTALRACQTQPGPRGLPLRGRRGA
jgi:hypothetical protein